MPRVIFINHQRGMAVVEIQPNLCSVIEIQGSGEINQGDNLTGNLNTLGSQNIRNQDTHDDIDIIVQNINIGQDLAIKRALLK